MPETDADTGIYNDRKINLIDQDLDKSLVERPLLEPIGEPSGMMHAAPAFTSSGSVQIRIHVRHHDKSFFCKDFRCFDGLIVIRKQIFGIVNNFDFDKVTTA